MIRKWGYPTRLYLHFQKSYKEEGTFSVHCQGGSRFLWVLAVSYFYRSTLVPRVVDDICG